MTITHSEAIDTLEWTILRMRKLERVARHSKELRESLRRCDRDGVPMINASALMCLDAALRDLEKK